LQPRFRVPAPDYLLCKTLKAGIIYIVGHSWLIPEQYDAVTCAGCVMNTLASDASDACPNAFAPGGCDP
jgi:hypothetical protein